MQWRFNAMIFSVASCKKMGGYDYFIQADDILNHEVQDNNKKFALFCLKVTKF